MTSDGPLRISNSEMAAFRDCRRKWWLQYFRGLAPKRAAISGPLPLGSRLHKALEAHYKHDADLLAAYAELLDAARTTYAETDPFPDFEAFDKEAELGRIMLEGYLEWVADEGVDSDLEILDVEEILSWPMLDGAVELTGKIDMRIRNKRTGFRSVLDQKSAASLTDFDKISHMSPQLKTYMLLDMLNNPEDVRIEGGVYRIMKKVKRTAKATPPFYREVVVRHNAQTLAAHRKQVEGTLRDIVSVRSALDAGQDHQEVVYPNVTRDCSWKCDFYLICSMFDDGSAVDSAIKDRFVEVDPYAYYESDASTEEGS